MNCLECNEPILPSDFPPRALLHWECSLRGVVGSVGHQRGTCSCKGGTIEDPPGMTKREQAEAMHDEMVQRVKRGEVKR